ncbi:Helicase associated domain protein [Streptomyces sp. S465]|nr:Helicase associated domain protein [Streptomyces sp. S465]WAP60656.1 Helicase associated domain protein [Streptomyces sp. S465]WAP61110.1 Helicase associated domain protein [Streptomyces sp. S465]
MTDAGQNPACVDTGLAHARSYAAEHGHLAMAERTRHHGFALGRWLLRQRHRVADGRTDPARIAALNALDPHWNPPWPLAWQRAYHRARTATTSGNLTAAQGRWITTQTQLWDSLHPTSKNSWPASAPRPPPNPCRLLRRHAATHRAKASPTPAPTPPNTGTSPCPNTPAATASLWGAGSSSSDAKPAQASCPPAPCKNSPSSTPGGTRPGPSPGNANTTNTAPSTPQASPSRPNYSAGPANRPPSIRNSTPTSRRS